MGIGRYEYPDTFRQFNDLRTRQRGKVLVTYSRGGRGALTTVRSWRRVIYGRTYRFTHITMPDGEVRWFVHVLTPYNNYDARFACAWKPVMTKVFPAL